MRDSKHKKVLLLVFGALLFIGAVFVLSTLTQNKANIDTGYKNVNQSEQQQTDSVEPYRTSLSGEYVCLPHKDTSGPQTLECMGGIKTDAGEYYAIDFYLMSQTHDSIRVGQSISANGVVQIAERLDPSTWQKYPIVGLFSVTDALQIIE